MLTGAELGSPTSTARAKPEVRLRVGSALLVLAMLNLPWASGFLACPCGPDALDGFLRFYVYHFTTWAILLCMLIALASLPRALWHRQWGRCGQHLVELTVCLATALVIPAY